MRAAPPQNISFDSVNIAVKLAGMNALDTAIRVVGTQSKLAEALGLSPMAVSQWRKRGVPAVHCREIERLTHGAVTVHDLRSDIFGPPPAATHQAVAA